MGPSSPTSCLPAHAAAPARDARQAGPRRGRRADLALYALLAILGAAAWLIGRLQWLQADDDTSYRIAVTGAVMMLALFGYPLRKRLRCMQGLGKVSWWFWLHLFFGITGPWLILVHSTFRVGSLNAGVALVSMGIVVASGVVGRFMYMRVHRGLDGERTSLDALRVRAGLVESDARSRLHFAPVVAAHLAAFEARALQAEPGWATYARQVAWLPVQRWIACRRCTAQARLRLRQVAFGLTWSEQELRLRERRARQLIERYLDAVVRVAQYTAYERLFALWHLAHLPFVYLLVISAVVHVIAVHAY